MTMEKGLIHLYMGNGKGKTTAAVGLAVRASGWGLKVLFIPFLKTTPSGEWLFFKNTPIDVIRPIMRHKAFIWQQTPEELEQTREDMRAAWKQTETLILSGQYDVVILDEVLDIVSSGFIQETELLETLNQKPTGMEIILTGRTASEALQQLSDYISITDSPKHPYHMGVGARKGIEF